MTKKVIIVASDAGNIGKTLIASVILETLRMNTSVDAYVCDKNFQGLYERYGEKKGGRRLPIEEQTATNGVAFLDISDPSQKSKFASCLGTDSQYLLFDLPANATAALATTLGTPEDFIEFMEYAEAEPVFVCPIKDYKSVESFRSLKSTFPNSKFVLAFNWGAVKASGDKEVNDKFMETTYAELKDYPHFVVNETLTEGIFTLIKSMPLREAYVPRVERTVDGVVSPKDSAYACKDIKDQFILNKFIPNVTNAVNKLLIEDLS